MGTIVNHGRGRTRHSGGRRDDGAERGMGVQGRDGRRSGAWLQPSLRVALPAALAAGAAVLVARLVSLDAAIVVAPVVTVLAIALVVGRASTLRKRQMGRIRRRLRQRMDAHAERQARLVLRET